jgi:hypothetical protein
MTKNTTKLFIRGGQLFLHNVRMFTQVGKKVFLAMLLVQILTIPLFFIFHTDEYQRYLGTLFLKAKLTLLVQYQAKIILKMPTGEIYPVFCNRMVHFPLIQNNNQKLIEALLKSFVDSLLASVLCMVLIVRWLQKRGAQQSKTKILRGSALVTAPQLQQVIEENTKISPYPVGGIYLPEGSETQHIQMVGTTGSGKTVAIRELLNVIRERGERAIVYDKGGTYLSRFYQEDKDIIL